MSKKIVACGKEINSIHYSGYTITKVYGCGGELVYDVGQEPTPCQTSSLPTPFVLNYNAKVYNSSTHTIPMTSGQSNNIDCVLTGDVQNVVAYQDHISLVNTSNVKALVTGAGGFNIHCGMTIVAKAFKTTNSQDSDLLVNRTTSNYNWMFRWTNEKVAVHGSSQINGVAVSASEPNIVSVVISSDGTCENNFYVGFKNHTTGDELIVDGFKFGSTDITSGGTMFAEYANNDADAHFWKGDFYWIYMTDSILTDYSIQKVIEYNESCFGVMFAWRKAPVTDYVCDTTTHTKYYKEYYQYSMDSGATWSNVYPTSSRTSEDVIEYNSADCGYVPYQYKFVLNDSSVASAVCDSTSAITSTIVSPYKSNMVEAEVGECISNVNSNAFVDCTGLTSVTLDNEGSLGVQSFLRCRNLRTVEIGSGVTSIGTNAFNSCTLLDSVTIRVVTPFAIGVGDYSPFNGSNDTFQIYVPADSVDAYKVANGWSRYASRIQAIP